MIENIDSNEDDKDKIGKNTDYTYKPPKNIKQVGESTSLKKVYVEDYVFTFIKELAKRDYTHCKIAVLLGKYIKTQDTKIIMINGAVEAENIDYDSDEVFTNDTWTSIYENIKKYFNQTEVVGWFIGGPGFILENDLKLKKIHLDNFAGVDKALLKFESMEDEEAFYIYEQGSLNKLPGYYIYYDKNDDMQNYIVDHKQSYESQQNLEQKAVTTESKEEEKEQKMEESSKSVMRLLYAAGSLMLVIVVVVFANMVSSGNKLSALEETVNGMKNNMLQTALQDTQTEVGTKVAESEETDSTLDVETISGNLNTSKGEVVGDKSAEDLDAKAASAEGLDSEKEGSDVKENEKDNETTSSTNDKGSEDEKEIKTEENNPTQSPKQDKGNSEVKNQENTPQSQQTSAITEVKYYTVEEGDTLAGICLKLYGTVDNIEKIIELNGIEDENKILYGRKLIVP